MIFEGCYNHFDEIVESDRYDDANIVPRIYQHSISRYQSNPFFPDALPNEYNHIRDITSLCIAMLCAESSKIITVLDIGGGFGASYIELIKRSMQKNFQYTVCEINPFFEYYNKHSFFEEKNISFINSFDEISSHQDLLIFGSSLQYFSNYSETLKNIIQHAQSPNYILITHTPMTTLPAFATAQINMDNKRIPNWIFNIDSLMKTFLEHGYQCIFKSAIHREGLFDDFKNDEAQYRSANLLFKKI